MEDLLDADATAIAAAVRSGEVSGREVVEATLRRIDARNPGLNAVIARADERALAAASAGPTGPLAGVPMVIKDLNVDVAGLPATNGSRLFDGNVADGDSEIVSRYRRAGAVIVGLTNTPEFGLNASTEPVLRGPTRNPHDVGRSPGGSSGGTAAAVAAGMVPVGQASDGGGSIRIPASCCGLVGLKPTRGRTPALPRQQTFAAPLSALHALTRTVRDSALMLDVASGPAVGDAVALAVPERAYAEEVGRDPGRCRIALTTLTPTGEPAHPDCAGAAAEIGHVLETLGHDVVEAAPPYPLEAVFAAMPVVMASSVAVQIDNRLAELGRPLAEEDIEPFTRILYEMAKGLSGGDVIRGLQGLDRTAQALGPFFVEHDLLLTPTIADPSPPLGFLDTTDVDAMMQRAGRFAAFTAPFNASGQPAISLPLGHGSDGLPIGVQLVAAIGREDVLLRVASQLETARPWPVAPVWPMMGR